MKNAKRKKYKASDYGLSFEELPKEIKEQVRNISKTRAGQIRKYYETPADYYTIYFGLKFIKNLSNSEIAKKLGKTHDDINHTYEGLNWEYDSDYKVNQRKYKQHYLELQERLRKGKIKAKRLSLSRHPKLKELLENPKIVNKVRKIIKSGTCGSHFIDYKDFLRQLYYFYCVERISPKDMCKMWGWSKGTMQDWVGSFGIRRTLQQGVDAKMMNGTQCYHATFVEGRNTRRRSQLKHGNTTASANENSFRNALADNIYKHFSKDKYDIGVCCNAIGILGAKEIDIPIFIYDREIDKLHRVAIEYNGPTHQDDSAKKRQARKRGWKYKGIVDKSEYASDANALIREANRICKKLAKEVS